MSWWNPFKKQDAKVEPEAPDHKGAAARTAPPPAQKEGQPAEPALPKELADSPLAKGMMGKFYRMWKNPAFVKQLRTLSAHMAKDGVDIKDMAPVKAWLEKNKDGIEAGKFNEPPQDGPRPQTFVKAGPDVGRNDPCPCGSGKKYKKCCAAKAQP
ncbi:MAG: SEC-C metal-binding domain-containing protein [Elusimicrobia bacterium]|nr:SEC-C metal-binding domain-containing protein [Elusimicrobiota bacterium]